MHRDREDEQRIEQRKPQVAVGARQHLARGQAAAHGVENGGEMHGDRERQHGGGQPLGEKQQRASWLPPQRAPEHRALEPGDRIGRRDRLAGRMPCSSCGVWQAWQPALPDTASMRASLAARRARR